MENLSPHRFLIHGNARDIVRCAKCGSVFVEDGICESCGFNSNVDQLGNPLGKRSFYAIARRFNDDYCQSKIFKPGKKIKARYVHQLLNRFNHLVDYILSDRDLNTKRRLMFWTETKALCDELLNYNVAAKELTDRIELNEGFSEYRVFGSELINYILTTRETMIANEKHFDLRNYKLFGAIDLMNFVMTAVILSCVVFLALSWYQSFILQFLK